MPDIGPWNEIIWYHFIMHPRRSPWCLIYLDQNKVCNLLLFCYQVGWAWAWVVKKYYLFMSFVAILFWAFALKFPTKKTQMEFVSRHPCTLGNYIFITNPVCLYSRCTKITQCWSQPQPWNVYFFVAWNLLHNQYSFWWHSKQLHYLLDDVEFLWLSWALYVSMLDCQQQLVI